LRAALTKAQRGEGCGEHRQFHRRQAESRSESQSTTTLPEVPIDGDQFGGEAADGQQLLAMLEMRRRLESGPAVGAQALVAAMTARTHTLAGLADTVCQLNELITAIDRRLPQVQRAGESVIANAAVRLRIEAEKRIAEIEIEIASRRSLDHRPAAF
jgi:hypothetical protein